MRGRTDGRRPIYHRRHDSTEAYLSAVCAALTVSHWIETRTITAAFSPIGLRKAIEAITRANIVAH